MRIFFENTLSHHQCWFKLLVQQTQVDSVSCFGCTVQKNLSKSMLLLARLTGLRQLWHQCNHIHRAFHPSQKIVTRVGSHNQHGLHADWTHYTVYKRPNLSDSDSHTNWLNSMPFQYIHNNLLKLLTLKLMFLCAFLLMLHENERVQVSFIKQPQD